MTTPSTPTKTSPRIVIAGSRALAGGLAPRLLVRFLAAIPPGSVILLRQPLRGFPGLFEQQTSEVCDLLDIEVEWCRPEPGTGREATFSRDLSMAEGADLVLAFHLEDQIGDETSGTAALVNKALEAEVCVYSFAVNGDRLTRVGEHDPDEIWSELLDRL